MTSQTGDQTRILRSSCGSYVNTGINNQRLEKEAIGLVAKAALKLELAEGSENPFVELFGF